MYLCRALAIAPFVDRGLLWFTVKFKFESQGKVAREISSSSLRLIISYYLLLTRFTCFQAFMAIVAFCLALAIVLFFFVTVLWA